jgi:hypothetical protein
LSADYADSDFSFQDFSVSAFAFCPSPVASGARAMWFCGRLSSFRLQPFALAAHVPKSAIPASPPGIPQKKPGRFLIPAFTFSFQHFSF